MFGIIGGVGPRATSEFYAILTDAVSARAGGHLPRLLMYSIGMTPQIENAFLHDDLAAYAPERIHVRGLLDEAITHFVHNDAKVVVMPCNTLQDEMVALCKAHRIAHINMIDETAEAILRANMKRLFVLGTTSTCRDDLYGRRLVQHGVTCIYPQATEQDFIKTYIRHALDQTLNQDLKNAFAQMVANGARECDGIIIACTDLTGDVSADLCDLPVFDSLQLLAQASADYVLAQKDLFAYTEESASVIKAGEMAFA